MPRPCTRDVSPDADISGGPEKIGPPPRASTACPHLTFKIGQSLSSTPYRRPVFIEFEAILMIRHETNRGPAAAQKSSIKQVGHGVESCPGSP